MLLSKRPCRADRTVITVENVFATLWALQLYVSGLKQIVEKRRDGQKDISLVFIDIAKAYNRIPREEVWRCTRQLQVQEN